MTGNDAPPTVGGGVPGGPPWPLELLADLHAGVFDAETTAELRARAEADPQARATLDALDATRATLAGLPALRMPGDVAARIDTALRAEAAARAAGQAAASPLPPAAGGTPVPGRDASAGHPAGGPPRFAPLSPPAAQPAGSVTDLAAARARRRRRGLIAGAGLLTAAAAVVGIVAVSGLTGQTTGTPAAAPSDQELPTLTVPSNDLGAVVDDTLAMYDYGPLGAAGRLDGCLTANRLAPTTKPLGAREVRIDGDRPGVLLILPTGTAGRLRLLVVSPDCGPGNAAVLADTTIGR